MLVLFFGVAEGGCVPRGLQNQESNCSVLLEEMPVLSEVFNRQ